MKRDIPDVSEGQRPSASWANDVRDAACREITGAVTNSSWGNTVVPIYAGMEVELYELTTDPELDDTERDYKAQAKSCLPLLVSVDGDGHYAGDATTESRVCRYRMMAAEREDTIWFPAGHRDTNGEAKEKPPEVTGSRVWTTISYGQRVVLGQAASSQTLFELYDDVGPGDTTNAKQAWRLKNSSGSLVRDTDADKIVVNDGVLGDVRAYGSNHSGFSTGAKGWASMEADGKYHIQSIQRLAKTIIVANTASGHAAVAAGTTSFTATVTRVCDDGQPPTVASPATVVVYNPGWEIDDNLTDIVCTLDTGTGISNCLYRIADADCPSA